MKKLINADQLHLAFGGNFMKISLHIRRNNLVAASVLLFLIASMAINGVSAQLPSVYVEPPSEVISAIGETATVEVKVANVSGLYGYDMWVGYNSTLLELVSTSVTGTGQVVPPSPSQYSFFDVSLPGTVRVAVGFLSALGAPSFNGTGTLLWITFNGTTEGNSTVEIIDEQTDMYDRNALPIETEPPEDGEIIVIPEIKLLPRVYVDPPTSIISAPGESVTVEVKVANVSGLYGYDMWVGYNSSILEHIDITVEGPGQVAPTDSAQRNITDKSELGTINYSVAFVNETPTFGGNGTLAWITFRGIMAGNTTLHLDPKWTKLYDYWRDEITSEPPVDGEIKVLPKIGDYHTHHINDSTDGFPNDYLPMVIPVSGKIITIAPAIVCTNFEDGVWKPNHYPCKSAQTLLVDDDWSDKDANYTYIFEDWTDYDWNDIVVSLYAVNNNLTINAETCLKSRDAAWKNPFGVEITPMGMSVEIHWNSTDYPENHIIQLNSGETANIELFAESNPCDTAFITIVTPKTYTLTITSTSGGTTDPAPDKHSYEEGTVVSVTAIPESGHVLNYWELDDFIVGFNTSTSVIMDKDHTLRAVFKEALAPVGGHAMPIDKLDVLALRTGLTPEVDLASISLLLAAMAVTIILIRRRNKTLRWGR